MWFAEFYGDIEMCTLMEKDALIELASDVQAYMARHNTTNLITDSELEIGKIKGWLYSTNPDFIDFNNRWFYGYLRYNSDNIRGIFFEHNGSKVTKIIVSDN